MPRASEGLKKYKICFKILLLLASTSAAGSSSSRRKQPNPQKARTKPGVAALREIRKYQSETKLLVPRLPFARVVKEICQMIAEERDMGAIRWRAEALDALQEAAEMYLTQLFEDA